MNRRLLVYPLSLLISVTHLFGQKQNNTWCFADRSEVSFNTGAPVSVNTSMLYTKAGSSSISDRATGALLFYSDGDVVYDKTNAVMSNGTALGGDPTCQQNSIIVPDPSSTTKYYIFCVSPDTISPAAAGKGLFYSTIDMTLNAGKGAVVSKANFLTGPVTGKITAVQHCNGTDYWVLVIKWGTDTMYSYPITASGIGTPVKSLLGRVYKDSEKTYNYGASPGLNGQMKASPNGRRIAFESAYYTANDPFSDIKFVQIYDFCQTTGMISNPNIDQFNGFGYGFYFDRLNGLSFSPNSDVLYVCSRSTRLLPSPTVDTLVVWQYNLNAGSLAAVLASKTAVFKKVQSEWDIDDFQLASNGKIYASDGINIFDAINSPNTLGAGCNYTMNVFTHFFNVSMYSSPYTYGLPNMIDGLTPNPPLTVSLGNDTIVCNGTVLNLTPVSSGGSTYSWSTGASTSTISVSTPGKYWLDYGNGSCCYKSDTINVTYTAPPTVSLTASKPSVCKGEESLLTASGGTNYSWNTGAKTDTLTVSPGVASSYTVTVSSAAGCAAKDSITINLKPSPTLSVSGSGSICKGQSLLLTASGSGTGYNWSNGATSTTTNVSPVSTSTYTVTATNAAGCTTSDSATVQVNTLPIAKITGDNLCGPLSEVLKASGGSTYLWNIGATADSLLITSPGKYSVKVTSPAGCSSSDSITVVVNPLPVPTVTPFPIDTIIKGNSVVLSAGGGTSYSWTPAAGLSNPDVSSPTASPGTTTTYIVTVKDNNNCTATDSVTIYVKDIICGPVFVPNAFSPNKDGHNDVYYVRGNCIISMDFVIFDRWGTAVFRSNNPANGWDGIFRGEDCDTGVFMYYLDALLRDGTHFVKKGNISLVR